MPFGSTTIRSAELQTPSIPLFAHREKPVGNDAMRPVNSLVRHFTAVAVLSRAQTCLSLRLAGSVFEGAMSHKDRHEHATLLSMVGFSDNLNTLSSDDTGTSRFPIPL